MDRTRAGGVVGRTDTDSMSGLRVLLVEARAGLARRLEPELRACVDVVRMMSVPNAAALEQALERDDWDVVVVSTDGGIDGSVVDERVRARRPGTPVVSASSEALRRSLRRVRQVLDRRNSELDRARSELSEREEQLRHAQKMEVIGSFAGGLAHDFNNIVMSIGGYAALLLQDWPAGHAGRSDLEEIVRSAEQAQALTRQLLGFARKEAHQARPLDLAEVIRDIEQLLRRSAGSRVAIEMRLEDGLPAVRVDPNQLQQVLLNLVLNARDAMPQGGQLRLGVDRVVLRQALDGADGPIPAGAWIRLVVEDDGIGMDPVARQRALEPFFTTKPAGRGTGLGLAMVHDILKRAGAHLHLTSEAGRGTTFEIFLPPVAGGVPDVTPSAHGGAGQSILLVEDEPTLLSLVSRLLKRAGYVVYGASNAEEALDLARDAAHPIHLLLTDVVLPGLNGRELAQMIESLRPGTPTLFMSGYADDVIQRAGLDMGRARILDKPFTPEDLFDAVRRVMAAGTAPAVARPADR